jgi:hypothetical protein
MKRSPNTHDTWFTDDSGNIRLESNKDLKSMGIQQSDTYVAVEIEGSVALVRIDLELK